MDEPLNTILGWSTVALLVALPVILGCIGLARLYSPKPLEKKYLVGGGGLAGGSASGLEV